MTDGMDNSLDCINFLDGFHPRFIYVIYKESHDEHVSLKAYFDFRCACNEVDLLRQEFPNDSYGLSKVRIIDAFPF